MTVQRICGPFGSGNNTSSVFAVVRTDENLQLTECESIVCADADVVLTLPKNPVAGQAVTVIADGGSVMVLGGAFYLAKSASIVILGTACTFIFGCNDVWIPQCCCPPSTGATGTTPTPPEVCTTLNLAELGGAVAVAGGSPQNAFPSPLTVDGGMSGGTAEILVSITAENTGEGDVGSPTLFAQVFIDGSPQPGLVGAVTSETTEFFVTLTIVGLANLPPGMHDVQVILTSSDPPDIFTIDPAGIFGTNAVLIACVQQHPPQPQFIL